MNTSIGTSRGKPGVADLLRDAHAPVDFHGARVAALHLRQELRRVFLLEENAAHAAAAEIDRERQPHRSGADNDDLGVHWGVSVQIKTNNSVSQDNRRDMATRDACHHRACPGDPA